MKNKAVIFHPYLFAFFPAISLVADHVRYIYINATIIGLAAFTILITWIILRVFRIKGVEEHKAGILVSGGLFLFFSYGHVFYFFETYFSAIEIRHRYLLPVWIVLILLFVLYARKTTIKSSVFTIFLNGMGTILILLSIVQLVSYKNMTRGLWEPLPARETSPLTTTRPDIYYIILDTYPNASTLQEFYSYDNQPFLTYLQDRGFFIASESFSNYGLTRLSLASSLNMMYFGPESQQLGEDDRGFELPRQMIENNTVAQFLKAQGYRFVFLGSEIGVSQSNRFADQDIRCGLVDETMGRIIQSTLIWPFADAFYVTETDDRNRRLCMFSQLSEMPAVEGPKFVFAHFLLPHQPFLFDAEGNPVHIYDPDPTHIKEYYVNQLIFVNRKMEEVVNAILEKSQVEPIIVIQGDTGPSYGYETATGLSPEIYQQRMRILNVYHFPQNQPSLLYPGISPVNTFRILLNQIFGTDYHLLEDESYFSVDEAPYSFTKVTEWVIYP